MSQAIPSSTPAITIRPSTEADIPAIHAIYEHAVLHGTGTFETEVPEPAEMARRRAEVLGRALPWLVAELDGEVTGYAYANYFRPRMAYRFCLEDSIYLAPSAQGKGLGRLLLAELIARCEAAGARQMLAVIGDSENKGSIGVHSALGFEHTGLIKSSGWKFGRWLDVVLMQRTLGQGDESSPGMSGTYKSKAAATWLSLTLGSLGLHRLYLNGFGDKLAWLHPVPTFLGLYGVQRMETFGQDDRLAWMLIPLLGLMLAQAMLHGIVYGLTPDEKWNAQRNPGMEPRTSGWAAVIGVILCLLIGGASLMATIAFSAQRYFENQV